MNIRKKRIESMKTPRALYRVPPLLISVSGRSNSPSSTQEIALKKKKYHFPLMVKLKIHILSHSQLKKEEKYEHEFAAEKCIDRLLTCRKNQQKIAHWNFRSFQSQLSLS